MSKWEKSSLSNKIKVRCDNCGKKREITKDHLRRISRGKYKNICRSCSKRIAGGLLVAARDKTIFKCPKCGKKREMTGNNLIKINEGKLTGNCRSCAQKGHRGYTKGLIHSEKTLNKMSEMRIGKLNPQWLGGITNNPYSVKFNEKLKKQIRKRDQYRCQQCFRHQDELYTKKGRKYKLPVHHIDYNKQNNKPSNLISLCRNCHSQTNFGREEWVNYFTEKVIR